MIHVKNIYSYNVKCNGESFNGLDYNQKNEMLEKLEGLYSQTKPKPRINTTKIKNVRKIKLAMLKNGLNPAHYSF